MVFRVAGGLWFVITGFIALLANIHDLSLAFAMGALALVAGIALLAGK